MNRRRKKRIPCPVCRERAMIFDRIMCDRCFMGIPVADRKIAMRAWREVQPYVRRHSMIKHDAVLVSMLFQQHRDQCAKMLRIAREQRRSAGSGDAD